MRGYLPISILLCLTSTAAAANTQFGSEVGHLASGMLLGMGTTWAADHYRSKQRAVIGFAAVLLITVAEELRQKASTTSNHISTLDIVATVGGGAIGATLTDRYLLQPVIKHSDAGVAYGLRLGMRF